MNPPILLMIAAIICVLVPFFLSTVQASPPRCYPPDAPFNKPKFDDCASLIDLIVVGDKASAPMQFSRDPQRGFRVPHGWINDTCTIVIDLWNGKDDTMKLTEIAFTAATVMHFCIGRSGHPNLDGRGFAGPTMSMTVILGGKKLVKETIDQQRNSIQQPGRQTNSSLTVDDQTS